MYIQKKSACHMRLVNNFTVACNQKNYLGYEI